jgi:hypothetical protein
VWFDQAAGTSATMRNHVVPHGRVPQCLPTSKGSNVWATASA